MKHLPHWLLLALFALSLTALSGCGGGGGGSSSAPALAAGTIYGHVIDEDGGYLQGIHVVTVVITPAGYADTRTAVTDAEGYYELADVPTGNQIVAFYGEGRKTAYENVTVGQTPVLLHKALQADATSIADAPTVDPTSISINNTAAGTCDISGTIVNAEVAHAVLIRRHYQHNTGRTEIVSSRLPLDADNKFTSVNLLYPNEDVTAYVWVANKKGHDISDRIDMDFDPSDDLKFRVTVTWDGYGYTDLHVWAPGPDTTLLHSYYGQKYFDDNGIVWNENEATGILHNDDYYGGPVNFTYIGTKNGTFRVAANSYSAAGRSATVNVTIFKGPNAGNYTYGPYLFSASMTQYPVTVNNTSWWRPCNIIVGDDGQTISVAPADQEQLRTPGSRSPRGFDRR